MFHYLLYRSSYDAPNAVSVRGVWRLLAFARPAEAAPRPDPVDEWTLPSLRRLLWIDRAARRLRQRSNRIAVPLAHTARTYIERRLWNVFGRASAEDACRERLDRSARWLRSLAVLGRGFDILPGLEPALTGDDGLKPLGRSAAVALSKVASPESVGAWIGLARRSSRRRFDQFVRDARRAKSNWPVAANDEPTQDDTTQNYTTKRERTTDEPAGRGRFPPEDEATPTQASGADAPRCQVRVFTPGPLRAAFDEVLELHRAASGRNVAIADFVEALVAESLTGPHPVDVERKPLVPARPVDAVERNLAVAMDDWDALDRVELPADPRRGPRDRRFGRLYDETRELLAACDDLDPPAAGAGTPAEIDRRLRELIALENRLERQLGKLLDYMSDKRAWLKLHFDGVGHYAAERLSLGRRTAQDRARVAAALERFPFLRAAYDADRVGLEPALLVLRALGRGPVAPWLEREWVDRAIEVSVTRLRDEVRVVRREWMLHGSWQPRPPLSDQEWQRTLALYPGTIRRRFSRLAGVAGSERLRDEVTDLVLRLTEPLANDFLSAIEDRRRTLAAQARTVSADVAASRPARTVSADPRTPAPLTAKAACRQAAHGRYRADHGAPSSATPLALKAACAFVSRKLELPSWVGLLALLEEYVATWDPPQSCRAKGNDGIYARDGLRCAAPGCTRRLNLEAHHLQFRSHGGSDDPTNLITLCRFHHHHGVHGALARCSGVAPLDVTWRLGRADVAEFYRNERRIAAP